MTNEVYNSQNKDVYVDESTHKLVVKKTQDTTNILEQNKIARNHRSLEQKGEFQRIAQIPLIALQIKTKQLFKLDEIYGRGFCGECFFKVIN